MSTYYVSSFTSDLNSSPLILIASMRVRVGPSKFQVKQEKRCDRGIEEEVVGFELRTL